MTPLSGRDLRVMWQISAAGTASTAEQQALLAKLGANANAYKNAYAPGGQFYNGIYQSFGASTDKQIATLEAKYATPVEFCNATHKVASTVANNWADFNKAVGYGA